MPWRNQLVRRIDRLHHSPRICFLVLFGSFFGSTAAYANNLVVPFSRAGFPFAIADFDGTRAQIWRAFSRNRMVPHLQATRFDSSSAQPASNPSVWSGPRGGCESPRAM